MTKPAAICSNILKDTDTYPLPAYRSVLKNMKKLLALFLLIMLLFQAALAEPARDVTMQVGLEAPGATANVRNTRDNDEESGMGIPGGSKQYVYIIPADDPVAAVYIEYGLTLSSFDVEVKTENGWQVIAHSDNPGYAQVSLSFAPQSERFRLHFTTLQRGDKLSIREMRVYTEGELDEALVHNWQPAPDKADILFLVAHPDDELLWFGGAIPDSVDRGKSVQVVYLTCADKQRRLELLNGLWRCGVRTYPEIGNFRDFKGKQEKILDSWGRKTVRAWIVTAIRRYKPEVIVTHDLKGEYGHPQHIVCSKLLEECVTLAADPSYRPDTGEAWQVKKVYRHLGTTPTTKLDWDQPLSSFNGETGIEIARAAMEFHVSQISRWKVAAAGDQYDSTLYTLIYSTVGEDTTGNDLFEHID